MHSKTLLFSSALHAQSRNLPRCACASVQTPIPEHRLVPISNDCCCSRFMDPAQPSSASARMLSRGYHAESFGEKIKKCSQNDSGDFHLSTILFQIITRMKVLFSNFLGDYSYSFQGSSELISITVTVSLFLQNGVTANNSPQEFPSIFGNYSYMI